MCARFTVLSDPPIASAIVGCVIPLSRNNTIWMRWRCAAGIFHRSAVFSRRTSALLHLTICFPRIRWRSESHFEKDENRQPKRPVTFQDLDSSRYRGGISCHAPTARVHSKLVHDAVFETPPEFARVLH